MRCFKEILISGSGALAQPDLFTVLYDIYMYELMLCLRVISRLSLHGWWTAWLHHLSAT